MTVLVTGGAGFMGSHVVDALVEKGCKVVALDDLSGGFKDNVNEKANFVEGSILDSRMLESLFEEHRFTHVFHLAAYAAEGLSHFIRHFNYSNNLMGSVNLINLAVRYDIRCFVFTSSIAVYGGNQLPMSEDMTPRPEDPYGISKLAVEQDLAAAYEMFGLNYIVFRPHNVYGERQNIGDKYRNVIGIFMNQLMQGEEMTVFGDGEQTRAFSYIGEVAPVMVQAAFEERAYNEIYNVGSDDWCSVNNLAKTVAAAFGVDPRIKHLPERNEVKDAYASHEKIERTLGAPPRTTLDEGLRRMAEWARGSGPRQSAAFSQIEIKKNLPPSWS